MTLTLYPQAPRDTDTPDRGYHYEPADYTFGFAYFTNSTVQVLPGTVIGTFSTAGLSWALGFGEGGRFICEGTADALYSRVNNVATFLPAGGWAAGAAGLTGKHTISRY